MAPIRGFQWDPKKNADNIAKHGIDFDEAIEVFYQPHVLLRSDRDKEERWIAIGESESRLVAVVFTRRRDELRIISARPARTNEARTYRKETMGRAAEGQD